MKFLDRVKLLIRSTVGSAFCGGPARASSNRRRDRLLDEARSQLETLREDLAGAEKRGDDALAGRLRDEIAELQRLLDEVEARQQVTHTRQRLSPTPQPSPTSSMAQAEGGEATSDAQLDETRIADQIRKLREGQ